MSRKINLKKRFCPINLTYNHFFVNLFINKLLKSGEKYTAKKIMKNVFHLLQQKNYNNPLLVIEQAVRNVAPLIHLQVQYLNGAAYQIPEELTKFRSINLAIRWLLQSATKRTGYGMSLKLTNELIDAYNNSGTTVKLKEETHKKAEANKTFLQFE